MHYIIRLTWRTSNLSISDESHGFLQCFKWCDGVGRRGLFHEIHENHIPNLDIPPRLLHEHLIWTINGWYYFKIRCILNSEMEWSSRKFGVSHHFRWELKISNSFSLDLVGSIDLVGSLDSNHQTPSSRMNKTGSKLSIKRIKFKLNVTPWNLENTISR